MKFLNKLYLSVFFLALMTAGANGLFAATPPEPTYGTAVVDGITTEWNLVNDFFGYMYRAGRADKPIESSVHLRYDCNTHTVYVLVLTNGVPGLDGPTWVTAAWAAINTTNNKVYTGNTDNNGIPPDFEWVGLKYDDVPDHVQGYEASFHLDPGSYKIIVHIEVFDSGGNQTSATLGFPGDGIPLVLDCTNVAVPGIHLNKFVSLDGGTTWLDAQTPPGPTVYEGSEVYFKFVVTNAGNVDLANITLTDPTYDAYIYSSCTVPTTLSVGGQFECVIGPFTAVLGQNTNTATATGDYDGTTYDDPHVANYYGERRPEPNISVIKYTNGNDANTRPGPQIIVGNTVTWTYVVTNTGNVDLTGVTVTDDILGLVCDIGTLHVGETVTCEATGTATAGQYDNTAIASGTYGTKVYTARDVSHYYGEIPLPEIRVVKLTQGYDWAHQAPGPYVLVGDPVTWEYIVTNIGNVPLTGVTVTDNILGSVTECYDSLLLNPLTPPFDLGIRESAVCVASGTATAGQYSNTAEATGSYNGEPYSSTDISYYFGAQPGISLVKSTNDANANTAPGPYVLVGGAVTWKYDVTNTGNVDLSNVTVTDDIQGPICTVPSLPAGGSATCTATGTASAGQYENTATVTGTPPGGLADVTATDPSHYFGAQPGISLVKKTNTDDANTAPGPYILVGGAVTWNYDVTNTGNVDLTNVIVTDDKLGTICTILSLPEGGSATCTAAGTASAGQYENTATVTGTPPGGLANITATDPSHYFGAAPSIDLLKYVSVDGGRTWLDANITPWPQVLVGGAVYYKFVVTNTGNVTLTDVFITDPVTGACTVSSTLLPGQSSECVKGPITAVYGINANSATAAGTFVGNSYTHTDSATYFGTLCSYTQGGYAGTGKPGQILKSNFFTYFPSGLQAGIYTPANGTAFPNGYLWQSTNTGLKNLQTYLAGGGTSGFIASDQQNPTKDPAATSGGTLARQTVTLLLNITFSGIVPSMPAGYGGLFYCNTGDPLSGKTVSQILAIAKDALANGASKLPAGYTYGSLNVLINNLNLAFDNCTATGWAQTHLKTTCP